MKARRDSFQSVYELYDKYQSNSLLVFKAADKLVYMSDNLEPLLDYSRETIVMTEYGKRVEGKIATMHKWVKGADILVIKDNNKPMLFLKYL